MRDDGALATLAPNGTALTIKSKMMMAKETMAKKLEAKPSLEGF
jgi:hypothetical protein